MKEEKKLAVKNNVMVWIGLFVLAMIGVVLMIEVSNVTTQNSSLYTNTNQSLAGTANGVNTTLSGKNFQGTPVVVNRSLQGVNFSALNAGSYTVVQRIRNGKQVVEFQLLNNSFASQPLNITYTWEPEGYIEDSGGRNVFVLILVVMAFALIAWVLAELYKMDGIRDMLSIGRR